MRMRRRRITNRRLGVVLTCLVLAAILSPIPRVVEASAKFNMGDTVEVINTLDVGLKVRDAPAGNVVGKEFDGSRGVVLDGPTTASLGGTTYTWWRIRYEDGLEGWSAEGYPGGVDYLQEKSVSPSTKFSIGDPVKVTASTLNIRTDPPELAYKGEVHKDDNGVVTDGPFYGVPKGSSGFYHFWKVDYGDIVGWSAEDWLQQSSMPTIKSRIDSYTPSSLVEVTVGESTTISVAFTNTGDTVWNFIAGATVWDSRGNQIANYSKTLSTPLQPGQQKTVSWNHPVNDTGDYWLQFGIWKATPYTSENLLDKEPEPSRNLIRGIPPPQQPTIDYSPSSFSFSATQGGSNPSSQTLSIRNSGGGTLNWSVSDDAAWLSLSPTSGTSTGETDSVVVSVSISGMSAGSYSATITISASEATNTPQSVPVSLTIVASPRPDLIIEGITWSPASPSIGETVTFTIMVKNQGSTKTGSSKVCYFIDNVQQGYDYVSSIDPGATTTETFTWKAQDGTHTVRAVADYEETVDESDETNNGKTITFSATVLSDLIIESITWLPTSPSIGDTVTFTVTVKNQGTGRAGSSKVYYFVDSTQRGYDYVSSLDPQATTTETFTWKAQDGAHAIKVVADYTEEVAESNETNNGKTLTFSTTALSDLIIESITWLPASPSIGDTVTFTVAIKNQGSGKANTSKVYYFIDTTQQGYDYVSSIDQGATATETFSWKALEGSHAIKAVADYEGQITESDETNNEKILTLSLGVEVVSVPNTPSGPTTGTTAITYTYLTGGATSSLGHDIEYRFDWGDGSYSSWSSSTSASHSWSDYGAYTVRAQARCATHTDVVSEWSSGIAVNVLPLMSVPCHGCHTCYSTKEEAVSHVPDHIVPKGCFVWKDGPLGYPWRVIPGDDCELGTGCAHWVAHQLGIRMGEARCYDEYSIRVGDVIAGRTEVGIESCEVGDIWATNDERHCGIVCQVGDGRVWVEHDSSEYGGVVTTWCYSGKCWREAPVPQAEAFPGASAVTLGDYYLAWGKELPSLGEQAKMYEAFGLGSASEYTGTAEQNAQLLNAFKQRQICPSTAEEAGWVAPRSTLETIQEIISRIINKIRSFFGLQQDISSSL